MVKLVVQSKPEVEYPLVKASDLQQGRGKVAGPTRTGGSEHPAKLSVTAHGSDAHVVSMRVSVGGTIYTARFDHENNLVSMSNPKGVKFPTGKHLVRVPEGTVHFKNHVGNSGV